MLSKPELRRLGFAFRELLSQSNPPPDSLLALIKSAADILSVSVHLMHSGVFRNEILHLHTLL